MSRPAPVPIFYEAGPEIRCMIYREILVPPNALHVRRTHQRLCSMPCRNLNPQADRQSDIHSSCWPPLADDGTVLRRLPGEPPRQNQILPLLCSCRGVYTEAIRLLYEANRFHFDSPLTVQALPLCMVPRRLASIRYIRLDIQAFENRAIVADVSSSWEEACTVLAGIEALEELVVILRSLDKGTMYKPLPLLPLLRPLTKITALRYVVEVPPLDDPEEIVGGLGVVPFTLETRDFLHGVIHQCSWWGREESERPRWLPPL
ncbi:uncharacterized protein P174DRAFT_506665 [Aspergillus novofumigatus IBT 16806]|uniref:DUF7730 domain-containing protein n=1 Tax=Aspergillus novofumigatus (strain IBT 16806) TaxID=1392255 RepID=A0A2I1C0E6_ASPN1|nr:uncharacterized protein P174DRAFT_506665 [Aspergillus novofumigatus IBT 16806]PKX91104.1 hypothetical protein P174DRAFT_506665 [Aspergillus novofumigatus IBT 16806]